MTRYNKLRDTEPAVAFEVLRELVDTLPKHPLPIVVDPPAASDKGASYA
jgi:hypothetical protein